MNNIKHCLICRIEINKDRKTNYYFCFDCNKEVESIRERRGEKPDICACGKKIYQKENTSYTTCYTCSIAAREQKSTEEHGSLN